MSGQSSPPPAAGSGRAALQFLVFSLVAATFATIYITQPVLPVLRAEFGVSESAASLTVSAVILGIALATLPFGRLADAYPVRRLMLAGAAVVGASSLVCAATYRLEMLVAARFVQGLFIPSLTNGLVVYLVRSLPPERLNVVMGSYVSATVAGGLLGRLLGGWIHPPLHWRYAFATSAILLAAAAGAAVRWLPRTEGRAGGAADDPGFIALLARPDLRRVYAVAFAAFFVFSSVFNYLPFYLAGPPFGASTGVITLLYLSYLVGVATGPLAGTVSDRIGNGATMVLGAALFAAAILLTLVPSMAAVAAGLALVCAGFFAVHAAAAGSLNKRLSAGRGRANSLYVLLYYLGGAAGISAGGYVYGLGGWSAVAALGLAMLGIVAGVGFAERRDGKTA